MIVIVLNPEQVKKIKRWVHQDPTKIYPIDNYIEECADILDVTPEWLKKAKSVKEALSAPGSFYSARVFEKEVVVVVDPAAPPDKTGIVMVNLPSEGGT